MRKVYHALCKAEEVLCAIGFCALIFFVFLSALLRFGRISMAWNIDLAMLLLAWTSFLGADIAWREGKLLGVDLVTRQFPKAVQKIIMILIFAIITLTMLVIAVYGVQLMWTERVRTYQSMPIPYSLVTMSIVVAGASMVISGINKIKKAIVYFNKEAA
jgi:TRAP-type C4-dicarboxylate transport system permease small subunit